MHQLEFLHAPPLLPSLWSDGTFGGQGFTEVTQSDTVHLRLTWLRGLRRKKLAKLAHMFKQPFHKGTAGDALPTAAVSSASAANSVTAATSDLLWPSGLTAVEARVGGGDGDGENASRRMGMDTVWDIESIALPNSCLCEAQECLLRDM